MDLHDIYSCLIVGKELFCLYVYKYILILMVRRAVLEQWDVTGSVGEKRI